jgi:hypothetical protein
MRLTKKWYNEDEGTVVETLDVNKLMLELTLVGALSADQVKILREAIDIQSRLEDERIKRQIDEG